MRIEPGFTGLQNLERAGTSHRPNRLSDSNAGFTAQNDVSFSSSELSLSHLADTAMSAPEIRSERVAQLRTSILDGTYHVEPAKLADAMLNELF